MTIYIAKMQIYKNFLKKYKKYYLQQKINLLIRILAAFFLAKIIVVIWLSFSIFYLLYLFSEMPEILLKSACIK